MKKILFAALLASSILTGTTFAGAPLDINTADATSLADRLNGVGLKKAEAIVAWRSTNGPFLTVDDLALVKGIGASTVDRNRENLTVVVPRK